MENKNNIRGGMAFSWGSNSKEIIFLPSWPGHTSLSYTVALAMVFLLSVFVEWLSHVQLTKTVGNVTAGMIQTIMYGVRVAAVYLVMLAVMSLDGGIFLAAVAGYAFGFMIFGSRVFMRKWQVVVDYQEPSDLPPLNC